MERITFVDGCDNVIGCGSKHEALSKGLIHRVSRVFLLNSAGEVLIQRRGYNLNSLPGRWDQSVSGHVREGESYLAAAYREMKEEAGVEELRLDEIGNFYFEESDEPHVKKRFNATYLGRYDGLVIATRDVDMFRWVALRNLEEWMLQSPEEFTQAFIFIFGAWFGRAAERSQQGLWVRGLLHEQIEEARCSQT